MEETDKGKSHADLFLHISVLIGHAIATLLIREQCFAVVFVGHGLPR